MCEALRHKPTSFLIEDILLNKPKMGRDLPSLAIPTPTLATAALSGVAHQVVASLNSEMNRPGYLEQTYHCGLAGSGLGPHPAAFLHHPHHHPYLPKFLDHSILLSATGKSNLITNFLSIINFN